MSDFDVTATCPPAHGDCATRKLGPRGPEGPLLDTVATTAVR